MVRRQLYLHVGLPKCASTSLQIYWYTHREEIERMGLSYPDIVTLNNPPKHQFLVGEMRTKHKSIRKILAGTDAQNILLSTEGLTNHFYDFPEQGLRDFREATSEVDVIGVFIKRDPEIWLKSYYKQCVINPRQPTNDHYATPLEIEFFRQHPKVNRMLNFERLIEDVSTGYGLKAIHSVDVGPDLLDELAEIGLPRLEAHDLERQNISPPNFAIEAIRQVNGFVENKKARNCAAGLIGKAVGIHHVVLNWYIEADYDRTDQAQALNAIHALQPNDKHSAFFLSKENINAIQTYA